VIAPLLLLSGVSYPRRIPLTGVRRHPVRHDVVALHARACQRFGELVQQIDARQWTLPTPCPQWNVRALVDHVVRWNQAVPRQLDGATVAQLAAELGDDVLGADP